MGLEHDAAADRTLHELQRLSWILAYIATGGIEDAEDAPIIRFRPGVADRGTWCCSLEINLSKERGVGPGFITFSGTIESVLIAVRKELSDRLGNGYL